MPASDRRRALRFVGELFALFALLAIPWPGSAALVRGGVLIAGNALCAAVAAVGGDEVSLEAAPETSAVATTAGGSWDIVALVERPNERARRYGIGTRRNFVIPPALAIALVGASPFWPPRRRALRALLAAAITGTAMLVLSLTQVMAMDWLRTINASDRPITSSLLTMISAAANAPTTGALIALACWAALAALRGESHSSTPDE